MKYQIEVLHQDGVSFLSGTIEPEQEAHLRFWTGVETHFLGDESIVMGDTATFKEFMRIFDKEKYGVFDHAWAGTERCRMLITL